MKKRLLVSICIFLLFSILTSCLPGGKTSTPEPQISAELIAYAGHGMLLDKNWKEIQLTPDMMSKIQDEMLEEAIKNSQPNPNQEKAIAIEEAQKLLKSQKLDSNETIFLKSALISAFLETSSKETIQKYKWRNSVIYSYWWERFPSLREEILRLVHILLLLEPQTDYMNSCRAAGVPVPPDWAESGTAWVLQGTLTHNILQPGQFAAVWTYSDPAQRGACIALPRRSGGPGSPAGIICQSASTGNACFWDNVLRDEVDGIPGEQFVGWSGLTLNISDLKDGSNLNNACTNCHRGNNVFLISPDDPTWAKVLRGPLSGTSTGTFTTRVEASTDNRGDHPRYIPVSGQPGWENPFLAVPPGTCTNCHEQPAVSAVSAMPPACATSITDPAGCYGTP